MREQLCSALPLTPYPLHLIARRTRQRTHLLRARQQQGQSLDNIFALSASLSTHSEDAAYLRAFDVRTSSQQLRIPAPIPPAPTRTIIRTIQTPTTPTHSPPSSPILLFTPRSQQRSETRAAAERSVQVTPTRRRLPAHAAAPPAAPPPAAALPAQEQQHICTAEFYYAAPTPAQA